MPSHLVIVESPAKAKTIKKFLGKDYTVKASMGHVRDLPKKEMGVDIENDTFLPTYEISEDKKTIIRNLKEDAKDADVIWIATDEDREGEAIGWHLVQALGIKNKKDKSVKRIAFHEITEEAIKEAILHPREINLRLVDAQQARRILDRLVGYTLSPFLWVKVYRGLSAGRVQSVAVRLVVDREREIQAFNAEEYWTVTAHLQAGNNDEVLAELRARNGEPFKPTSEKEASAVVETCKKERFTISEIEQKQLKKNPQPPFTTSTLQQAASNQLGFSVKQTMVVAQQLYEGVNLGKGIGQVGIITYMRTDSLNLSNKALEDARRTIEQHFGREYILSKPRTFKTKSKGAQEAHEAIRPTEIERTPESLRDVLDPQQLKLYTLIWNRTVATQMPPAELRRVGVDFTAAEYTFRATGQTVEFDGFLRVYQEDDDTSNNEKLLPPMTEGEILPCSEIDPEQHFTKPPARYTEASLVKKLEEEGIGRPSTYAPTISTVQQRGYIRKEGRQLMPETIAFTVTDLMQEHFPEIVDLQFTAKMEQSLDDIAEGTLEWVPFMRSFYGPFSKQVEIKKQEIKKEDVLKEREIGKDPETNLPIIVRSGRFGPYAQLGTKDDLPEGKKPKTVSLPKNTDLNDVKLETVLSLLRFPRMLGNLEREDVTVNLGRFGPYIRWGKLTATLPKNADPTQITLEDAQQIIADAQEKKKRAAEPIKVFGKDPATGGDIFVRDGRYGPYVTDGITNASINKKIDPAAMSEEQAIEILAKKRARGPGRGRFGKKTEVKEKKEKPKKAAKKKKT